MGGGGGGGGSKLSISQQIFLFIPSSMKISMLPAGMVSPIP